MILPRASGPIADVAQHDTAAPPATEASTAPPGAGVVLLTLILVAAVANLNLAVANVA